MTGLSAADVLRNGAVLTGVAIICQVMSILLCITAATAVVTYVMLASWSQCPLLIAVAIFVAIWIGISTLINGVHL